MRDALQSRLFDRAVSRFNARSFFEAHEDWEHLWHEAVDPRRRYLQGLIQIAAAFVHFERGYYDTGFVKLVREGLEKVLPFPREAGGLSEEAFRTSILPWQAHAERVADGGSLVEQAPDALPHLRYVDGHRPDPLPEDADPEDD